MKIALVTDAWMPQVNGVVTTLVELVRQLQQRGHEVLVIHPGLFRTRPCPGYAGIDLAVRPFKNLAIQLEKWRPDSIHLATEGPLGWAGRKYCIRNGLSFTTAFHTRFPEILHAALRIPLAWGYALFRHFHRPSAGVMVPTREVMSMLARRGLHVHSQFDTVAFDFDGEMRMWKQLDILLNRKPVLEQLQTVRTLEWQGLQDIAWSLMANFLLEVAAFVETIKEEDAVEPVLAQMQNKVRQRERHFQQDLLQAFRFYQQADLPADWMPKAFSQDPFDPELLKQFGLRTGTGAAVGALLGLGVDAATAGLSGGMGMALGGVIGGVLSNMGSLSDRISGVKTIHIDPATITLLATRAQALILALLQRGHAAQQALSLQAADVIWPNSNLPGPLRRARSHSEWSALNGVKASKAESNRREAAQELQRNLRRS